MPGPALYLLRKRDRFLLRGIRVTAQDVGSGGQHAPERWRASFRYIWDADAFIRTLCNGPLGHHYKAVDSTYTKPLDL